MLGKNIFQGPGLYIFRSQTPKDGPGNLYFHLVPQEALIAGLENEVGLEGVQYHGQNPSAASALLPGTSWGKGIHSLYVGGRV